MKINNELIAKAKQAKSPEELIALAKENGTELTEESAKAYFDQLHKTGEVTEDELSGVSGGGCGSIMEPPKFNVGDHVLEAGSFTCGTKHWDWRGAQRVMTVCDSTYLEVTNIGMAGGTRRVCDVKCPKCGKTVTLNEYELREA